MELKELQEMVQWALGDLVNSIKKNYGEGIVVELARDLNKESATLWLYGRVAKKFSWEERIKYPTLSWSHYSLVHKRVDSMDLLGLADEMGWSVRSLALYEVSEEKGEIDFKNVAIELKHLIEILAEIGDNQSDDYWVKKLREIRSVIGGYLKRYKNKKKGKILDSIKKAEKEKLFFDDLNNINRKEVVK